MFLEGYDMFLEGYDMFLEDYDMFLEGYDVFSEGYDVPCFIAFTEKPVIPFDFNLAAVSLNLTVSHRL